jgi:hypothetical protein
MLSGWAPPSDSCGEGQHAAHHVVRIVDGQQVRLPGELPCPLAAFLGTPKPNELDAALAARR